MYLNILRHVNSQIWVCLECYFFNLKNFVPNLVPQISLQCNDSLSFYSGISVVCNTGSILTVVDKFLGSLGGEPFPYVPWRSTGIKCSFLDYKGSQCWNLPLLCFWQQQPLCKSDNMAGKYMLG